MSHTKWSCLALMAAGGVLGGCSGGGGGGATPADASFAGDTGFPSDDGGTGDSGSTGDSGTGSDTGTGGDTGGPGGDSGTGACSSPDGGGLAYTGLVAVSRVNAPPTPIRYGVIAQLEATPSPAPPACGGTVVGSCCYQSSGTAPTPVYAGTITVTDGTATLVTLTPPTYAGTATAWAPGASLKFTAAAGTVDAFSGTVVAPALFAGVSPPLTAAITVSLKSDFVLTWTPGKEACSEVNFGFSQGAGKPYIGCVVADAAGTVTVPASLLGMFTATTGTAVLERVEGTHVLATNADVGLAAINVVTVNTTYTP
jgi:hypothetical protein